MRGRFLVIGMAVLLSLVGWQSGRVRAEIIITEIMYNPQGTDLDTTVTPNISREWAELYNTGTMAVDLSGWQFGDSQDGQWATAFPAGTTLGANQTLVVTGDSTSFDLEWGTGINRIQVGSFPSLANDPSPTNETAAIRNSAGLIQDLVNFDDANGWPKTTGSDGHSIMVLPQGLTSVANNVGANWRPSVYGVYGAKFRSADGENHGSPGFVSTATQAPFAPSPDAAWSMVVMPDTQNYAKSSLDFPVLPQITKWIRDHKDEYRMKIVLTEGDIVNNNNTNNPTSGDLNSTQQWENVKAGFSILDGHLPYVMVAGNHDFGFTNADNRDTMMNNYFKATDNSLTDPAQGGILKGTKVAGDLTNAYYAFTAPDGRKMLVFALEWEPRPATVTWANQIAALPEFADHTASLVTHNYLLGNNVRSTSTNVGADASGQELWDNLVKQHENFEMTFNGHFGGDGAGYLASTSNAGNLVHQMFLNTQFETHGGNGWIRILEFLQDGKTVRVRTYSPFLDLYRTTGDFAFQFQVTPIDFMDGDFNRDGVVDTADYVVWRDTAGSFGYFAADANGDNSVNEADYAVWLANFGRTSGAGAGQLAGVPEPSVVAMLLLAFVGAAAAPVRRR